MYPCEMCGRAFASKLIAEDCADQDQIEADTTIGRGID